MFRFLLGALIFCVGSLSAYGPPPPGSWTVEAEFLYLLATPSYAVYPIATSPTQDGAGNLLDETDVPIDSTFQPAFRIGGRRAFCDSLWEFQAYYTRLNTHSSQSASGGVVIPVVFGNGAPGNLSPGTISYNSHLLYQCVEGVFARHLFRCPTSSLSLQGGVEYAYFHSNNSALSTGTATGDPSSVVSSDLVKEWGVGPQLGLEFNYGLLRCGSCCPGELSLTAYGAASILATRFEEQTSSTTVYPAADPSNSQFTNDYKPTWFLGGIVAHARVGLNYAACFSCLQVALEVGYEFNTYDAIGYDIQGLYVSGAISF